MQEQNNGKLVLKLGAAAIGMFGFGFALVPLYEVFCDLTGLNGKTGGQYTEAESQQKNADRVVTIQFLANNNAGMPWEFRPVVRTMKVHPGEMNSTSFYVKNPAKTAITAQAVPSVTPFMAANYLHKTECFCFDQQRLDSGASMDMPLRFIIDSEIPEDVDTLTLSYTLFDITEQMQGQAATE
ncbi:MAG: cytochrome c oxidase assembly protein [Pseudomonadales bacterium]|nr:cytochrome c oxidase assembly protein [Pseudomonadales bacterium]